jgi:hypothetical protein
MPLLEKPEQPGQLPRDEVLKIQVQAAQIPRDELLQIPLRAAECRFYAGQYAEALVLFDRAADRYAKLPRTPKQTDDYLGALSGSIRCHGLLIGPMNNHRAKLRDRIAEMQLTLKDVDETTQAQLNGWIRDVETELRKRENKGE